MVKTQSSLIIKQFNLSVYLGWFAAERAQPQTVLVDIHVFFPSPPKACISDELQDTFCYLTLINAIKNHTAEKKFRLIEYLSRDIYQLTQSYLPKEARVTVHLIKHPPIENFTGQVHFSYGAE